MIIHSYLETTEMDFVPPTSWYIRDAMDNVVFVKCRSRSKAQSVVDEMYGKGKFRISSSKLFY